MTADKAQELLSLRRELEADIRLADLMQQDLKEKKAIRCGAVDYLDVLSNDSDLYARFVLAVEHRASGLGSRLSEINNRIGEWK